LFFASLDLVFPLFAKEDMLRDGWRRYLDITFELLGPAAADT
jgi:hypothetical protein